MLPFATEFPVERIENRRAFVAQVIAWLRGTHYSTVLDDPPESELEKETIFLRSQTGEELRLRQLDHHDNIEAIGFRHNFPDNQGRLWQTEAVLRRAVANNKQDLFRLRTQCVALEPAAKLETPKKPYLVKAVLQDGWGGMDGPLRVSDQPIWLNDDQPALELARAATLGNASQYLPIIYVSAIETSNWLISDTDIEKLAFDLGGIAHIVVEPDRGFSFRLRDLTAGANVYGGTLGVALPGSGIVRRFYLGWRLPDLADLLRAIREVTVSFRSQMPALGWGWTELQEQALRQQRERDRNRLSFEETEKLYHEEIANLREGIKQLQEQNASHPFDQETDVDDGLLPVFLIKKLGPELYPGEFFDRIRLAVKECSARANSIGLDSRSRAVFDVLSENLPSSPALSELREDLRRVTKDPKRVSSDLTALLQRHGYKLKSEKRHIRLRAGDGYYGLESITVPKTPSEHRGLQNMRKQIEKILGISKL